MQLTECKDYTEVKVGIYTIACNEEKFVDRWVEAHKQADALYVLVNNSSDETFGKLRAYADGEMKGKLFVENVEYETFRFDVARNDNLKMIPSVEKGGPHILIQVDMDECLEGSWYDDFRRAAVKHPRFLDLRYYYAWSHKMEEGRSVPDRVISYNKCHRNVPGEVSWEFPVHETLKYSPRYIEESKDKNRGGGTYWVTDEKGGYPYIYLHHYPDPTKSRGSYLRLLELRAKENPDDLYGLFYLGREYTFKGMWQKSLETYSGLYARLTKEKDEMLMLGPVCLEIATGYSRFPGHKDEIEYFCKKAIEYAPSYRDSYVFYAQWLAYEARPAEALSVLKEAEAKTVRHNDWRESSYCWHPFKTAQIKADSYCWLGEYELAWKTINEGLNSIVSKEDEEYAKGVGFFGDFEWIKRKIQSLGKGCKKG